MAKPTFSDLVTNTMRARWYEPVATTRDRSVRELVLGPHHIRHRFEFKGGVAMSDIMAKGIAARNPLFDRLLRQSRTVAKKR